MRRAISTIVFLFEHFMYLVIFTEYMEFTYYWPVIECDYRQGLDR
jgi:hypothetical protein